MRTRAEVRVVVFVGAVQEFTLAGWGEWRWGWETGADNAHVEVGFDQGEAGGVGPETGVFVAVAAGEVVGFETVG